MSWSVKERYRNKANAALTIQEILRKFQTTVHRCVEIKIQVIRSKQIV